MKTISHSELRDLLFGIRCATPVTISALTKVDLPKMVGIRECFKLARVNGLTGTDYHAAIARHGGTSGARAWGSRLGALVEKGSRFYLTIRIKHRAEPIYLVRHGSLLKTAKSGELNAVLPKPDTREVQVRDYALTNIKRISIGGERYKVIEDIP